MTLNVAVIDYGVGNLYSVENALRKVGAIVDVISDPDIVDKYSHVLLPGVGAFKPAISALKASGMSLALSEHVNKGKPLLGICLGMQLLAMSSEEDGFHAGMGWVPATVRKLPQGENLKIPHMGWNSLQFTRDDPMVSGLTSGVDAYFVHSYFLDAHDEKNIIAKTEYGDQFCSMVRNENVYGMQFHPEKSQDVGLRLLKNFIDLTN